MKTDNESKIAYSVISVADFDTASKTNEFGWICLDETKDFDNTEWCGVWGNPQRIIKALRAAADHLEKVSAK